MLAETMFNKQIVGEWQRLAFHKYEIGIGLKIQDTRALSVGMEGMIIEVTSISMASLAEGLHVKFSIVLKAG